jgi:beta-glucanase (GH16 family)
MTGLPEMSDGADSELRGWDLGWSDEFDGPLGAPADPSVWHHEVGGGGWGNDELQYYTGSTENASLDGDSNLAIVVRRTGAHAGESFNSGYTSARLVTKDAMAFSYGLVTARMKLPGGRGCWPGLWMLGDNLDEAGWPACGEIDIMEHFGDGSAVVHGTVHGPGYSGGVTASCRAQSSLSDEFHIYTVCWEPQRIRWYLDDDLYATVTPASLRPRPWVFDHDFFLLVNVAAGGTMAEAPGPAVTFPQTMLVDYIRVYTPAGPG